jgi:hypothetical protein
MNDIEMTPEAEEFESPTDEALEKMAATQSQPSQFAVPSCHLICVGPK